MPTQQSAKGMSSVNPGSSRCHDLFVSRHSSLQRFLRSVALRPVAQKLRERSSGSSAIPSRDHRTTRQASQKEDLRMWYCGSCSCLHKIVAVTNSCNSSNKMQPYQTMPAQCEAQDRMGSMMLLKRDKLLCKVGSLVEVAGSLINCRKLPCRRIDDRWANRSSCSQTS